MHKNHFNRKTDVFKKWPESFTIVPYRGPLLEKFVEKRVIVPYRRPLLVPYSGPLLVPYNALPVVKFEERHKKSRILPGHRAF